MSHIIKTRKDRNLPLDSLLALLIHVYSLTGTEVIFNKQHEDNLQETLSVAIFEDHKSLLTSDTTLVTPEQCEDIAKNIMGKLKEISHMRKILNKYVDLFAFVFYTILITLI